MKESHAKILDAYQNLDRNVLYINATQLMEWTTCKEKHRKHYLLQREPVEPNIHRQFGSVIHTMAEGYWSGKPYMESFHAALKEAQELDPRLLSSKNQAKWSALQDVIAPITTIYYGYHGDKCSLHPPRMNEEMIEWPWGEHAGISVICNGIIDRFSNDLHLIDTKTASAVGTMWKSDLKKRLLREPQMGFYLRYLHEVEDKEIPGIEYEIIVKPYRGSDPRIETIDVTDEVMSFQPVFIQQMDWAIREICEFYAKCRDAEPWPMSNTACTTSIFGECEFLPVCSGKTDLSNQKLYKIKEKREVEV